MTSHSRTQRSKIPDYHDASTGGNGTVPNVDVLIILLCRRASIFGAHEFDRLIYIYSSSNTSGQVHVVWCPHRSCIYDYCQRVASLGPTFFPHEVSVVAPSTAPRERFAYASTWFVGLVSFKHEKVLCPILVYRSASHSRNAMSTPQGRVDDGWNQCR